MSTDVNFVVVIKHAKPCHVGILDLNLADPVSSIIANVHLSDFVSSSFSRHKFKSCFSKPSVVGIEWEGILSSMKVRS